MNHEQVKAALDVTSLGVIGATLLDYLPYVAAVLPIVYWAIRIYETKTVCDFVWHDLFGKTDRECK